MLQKRKPGLMVRIYKNVEGERERVREIKKKTEVADGHRHATVSSGLTIKLSIKLCKCRYK